MTIKKLKDISTKNLGYGAKELRKVTEDAGGAVFLYRVGGIVLEQFSGEGKTGDWTGFKGRFFAANKDGEKFESTVAYFPATITTRLKEQFSRGEVEIEIKADVFVIETDKVATGYAYMCEPVLTETTDNRAQQLAKELLGGKLPTSLQLEDKSSKKKTA